MAKMDVDVDKLFDAFVVFCKDDEGAANQLIKELKRKGKKTYAHYSDGKFNPGKPIVEGIKDAVEMSKIVLILLTSNALKSNWVTLELLLSFEKAVRSGEMCIRIVLYSITDDELKGLHDIESIPKYILDFNRDNWIDSLIENMDAKVSLSDILPVGNVAHGLVYNYFAGFLRHILPQLNNTIESSDIYKQRPDRVLNAYIILLPDSCQIQKIDGEFRSQSNENYTITKAGSISIKSGHGDKMRSFNQDIYSITKEDCEPYFFLGECPAIMETMAKLSEFVEKFDKRMQVVRFRQALEDLVNHQHNAPFNNTVVFVNYDSTTSHAQQIWDTITMEKAATEKQSVIRQYVGSFTTEQGGQQQITVTVSNRKTDNRTAEEIIAFLKDKNIGITFGDEGKIIENLKNMRWSIFVLSKEALRDKEIADLYDKAISASMKANQVRVLPILSSDTKIADLPKRFTWATVMESVHPQYLERLWEVLNGGSTKMHEQWPAGQVYEGLAWSYLLNYLPITLLGKTAEGREFKEKFEDGMVKFGATKCVTRLFIIVPKDCKFPPPGPYFEGEKHLGALEPAVVGFRKYFLQFYEIALDNGERVCYAREYATPTIALHEMATSYSSSSGLGVAEMHEQSTKMAEFLTKAVTNDRFKDKVGDLSDRCSIVQFNDTNMSVGQMTSVLKQRLSQCIDAGDFITQ